MSVNPTDSKGLSRASDEDRRQGHQNHTQASQSGRDSEEARTATGRDAVPGDRGSRQPSHQAREGEPVIHGVTLQRAGRAVSISTWLLFAVNLGTLFVIVLQWLSMEGQLDQMKFANDQTKRQADAAESANKLAYRSYLTVSPVDIIDVNSNDRKKIDIKITNNGKTPALQVKYKFRLVGTYRPSLPIPEPIDEPLDDLGAIFSDSTYITAVNSELIVGRRPLQNTSQDLLTYYVIGRVSYIDAFGGRHKIDYCSYIDGRVAKFTQCPDADRNYAD
jgi:hypothetical protein